MELVRFCISVPCHGFVLRIVDNVEQLTNSYHIYHKTGDRLKGFREAVRSLQNLRSGGKE